jgi:hypothetical protein
VLDPSSCTVPNGPRSGRNRSRLAGINLLAGDIM